MDWKFKIVFNLQYTLLTELREIVAVEDRVRFDELVYRRDVDMPRGRDPREHDYRHSRVSLSFMFAHIKSIIHSV